MAKDDSERKDKKDKKEKKEKKEKKDKRSETNGVHKSKDKKDKKVKHLVLDESKAEQILSDIESSQPNIIIKPEPKEELSGARDVKMDIEMSDDTKLVLDVKPRGALVPFANPLADEKAAKKVFKSVKKAAKAKTLKRGVKEVVKALRKSPLASAKSAAEVPMGILVIAADISPMDVISHLPVLAEDHGIPYIYVTSRAELGAAGSTKRPTSVVLVDQQMNRKGKAKKDKKEGASEGKEKSDEEQKKEWEEVYADLLKIVRKAGRDVRI